ncbi:MAG: 16S rRNA (guanine(966)-N(2))-methyltransferase RsmD [Porticoccaceae bacterium]
MKARHKQPARESRNRLRIIAGQWRGRRLSFPDAAGLRPTGDRIRETLFNWIGPRIAGSRCLDAFAGSGALGFEALSRGAKAVVMVESDRAVFQQLQASAALLGAEGAILANTSIIHWLEQAADSPPFDIIFLDPPFASDLLAPTVELIASRALLAADGLVYIETPANAHPPLPADWHPRREKRTGNISCKLIALSPGARPGKDSQLRPEG